MQRIYALLLLLAASSGLVTPLLSLDTASRLPACCRRDGKHRCSMSGAKHEAAGIAITAAKCPLYPGGHATPAQGKLRTTGPIAPPVHTLVACGLAAIPHEVLVTQSRPRDLTQRGPPVPSV